MADKFSCGLILLAAGASTRMGRPKQLLPINGRPLLRHLVESALAEPVSPIVVVLGANATEIASSLDGLPVRIVINTNWDEGMGSSLRHGIDELVRHTPAVEGVIVALADQPDILTGHLAKLVETQRRTNRSIVASECERVCGPPVLFTAKYFAALQGMRGDEGARSLLRTHAGEVATVPLATSRDLDTPADYTGYLERNSPRITQIDADM